MEDWLFVENPGLPYDPTFPWAAVNVSNEVVGKFTSKQGAYMFVDVALERYGRVIDTRPEED